MENLSYEERKQALIEEITRVFDGVERGDGTTFYEGMVYDNCGDDQKIAAARAKGTETRWQDVPYLTFRENYAAISFLDPEGFRYYLPALMIWYLRYVDTSGPDSQSRAFNSIIFHLTLSDSSFLSRYEGLQTHESEAVAFFLVFDSNRTQKFWAKDRALKEPEMLAKGRTKNEIDALWAEYQNWDEARVALDKYWGQFLEVSLD